MTRREEQTPANEITHARKFGDAEMDLAMGRLLQAGVLLAAAIVAIGGAMYLWRHAHETPNYRTFRASPIDLRSVSAIARAVGRGDPAAVLELGILLLVATPIARVIFAVIAFAVERDRLYIGISAAVLAVLLFGLLHGV